jgi:hypothetical protein
MQRFIWKSDIGAYGTDDVAGFVQYFEGNRGFRVTKGDGFTLLWHDSEGTIVLKENGKISVTGQSIIAYLDNLCTIAELDPMQKAALIRAYRRIDAYRRAQQAGVTFFGADEQEVTL